MGKPKKIPLVSGLIGREAGTIHGQIEVSLINYEKVHVAIWRKAYSGLSNVEFSIADTDLQDIIDILNDAKKKVDTHWLSRIAVKTPKQREKDKRKIT